MWLHHRAVPEGARRSEARPEAAGSTAEWARRELGFDADAVQTRVLNSSSKRVILNCSRQWGKSTLTAAKAVYQASTNAGSLTLVVSTGARQSGEFVRKAGEFAARRGVKAKGDGDNEISLLFPNGARIVGLPGNEATVRGFSAVSLLVIDEASRVRDDLYKALRPMLAVSGGTLWLMSTPFGKGGFFWETWSSSDTRWERVRVTARDCPRIGTEFLEEERRTMGDMWFRQEYECEFVDAVSGVFDMETISRAVKDEVRPLEI